MSFRTFHLGSQLMDSIGSRGLHRRNIVFVGGKLRVPSRSEAFSNPAVSSPTKAKLVRTLCIFPRFLSALNADD